MTAKTPDALRIGYLSLFVLHLDRIFRANSLAVTTSRAFIRNNRAFVWRFFAS
jgi:hypothetical protein